MVLDRKLAAMSSDVSPSRQITVVDVYDLASAIGKDFEKLIDQFGTQCVQSLMPKVISSLETLEALASRNERESEEIASLKSAVERLESEKQERLYSRRKFEAELEQIEENYRKEIKELWEMVEKLQEENRNLGSSLSRQDTNPMMMQSLREEDLKLMLNLRSTVDEQRDQLKAMQKDNQERHQEMDSLQQQVDKLNRVNKELLRKIKAIQNQGRALVEEKVELIFQLQQREQHVLDLESKLGETEKARKDLEQTNREEFEHGENTPRFTLAELREVLQEKNSLKARVLELEEELAQLRPAPSPQPPSSDKNDEDELVVCGPINKEPEDKLYPWKYQRKDSGVRKFFRSSWFKKRQDSAAHLDRVACRDSSGSSSRRVGAPCPQDTPVSSTPLAAATEEAEIPIEFSLHDSALSFTPHFPSAEPSSVKLTVHRFFRRT